MHPLRKKTLFTICCGLLVLVTAITLVMVALKENINLYYTPTELVNAKNLPAKAIKVGGMVENLQTVRQKKAVRSTFILTDLKNYVSITYTGLLPDLFREGKGAVVSGYYKDNIFVASQVLAKHDENYMPPNIRGMKNAS